MSQSENIRVILEDCFLPSTGAMMRSIEHELESVYGPADDRVSSCPPTNRTKSAPLQSVVLIAAKKAQAAARGDDTMAAYVLPTSVGYKLNGVSGTSGIVITVAALKEGPVGVFIDFCDGKTTPLELIEIISRQADDLKRTVLFTGEVSSRQADRSEALIEVIREGFIHSIRYCQ